MTIGISLMLAIVGIAAFRDLRTRRIPNILTGTLAVIAVAAHASDGVGALTATIGLMLAAFVTGWFAFSLGWFGGGDVKLLAGCCGVAGVSGWLTLVAYTFVAGAAVSLIEAARERRLGALLRSTAMLTAGVGADKTTTLPYGLAIAAGASAFALSVSVLPALRIHL
ncbi:MAG: hypothetical protein NVS2B17_01660 [Candidatus Velthaea sp.]